MPPPARTGQALGLMPLGIFRAIGCCVPLSFFVCLHAHLSAVCPATETTFGLGLASLVMTVFLVCEVPKWLRDIGFEAVGAPVSQIKDLLG